MRGLCRLLATDGASAVVGQLQTVVLAASEVPPVKVPAMPESTRKCLPCSDSALGLSLVGSSQLITPHSLCHPHSAVEPCCRLGGARVDSHYILGCRLWQSNSFLRSELLPLCCLSKHQQRPALQCSDAAPGPGHLCVPQPSSLPAHGSPCFSVELRDDISRAGVFAPLSLGCTPGQGWETRQLLEHSSVHPLCPALGAGQNSHSS